MRFTRLATILSVAAIVTLLALNLRAQLRTQEKLEALAAASGHGDIAVVREIPKRQP